MIRSKSKRIDSFFKRKVSENDEKNITSTSSEPEKCVENPRVEENEKQLSKVPRVAYDDLENSLERDPGKRPQIWQYPQNHVDEIRLAYLKWGPYQMHLENYPLSSKGAHPRRFQYAWFKKFPSWLEYSPSEDAAYCLPCYLFSKKPSGHPGSDVFIATGFRSWKKVNNGKNCAFLIHTGKDSCSRHNNAVRTCQDLLNQDGHIRNVIHVQSSKNQIMKNQLLLKTSIDIVRFLTFQALYFRDHEEISESSDEGIFLEMMKFLASYNDEVAKAVSENSPYISKSTSHQIQKEILHIFSSKVKNHIREEIGDSKFCLVVYEARDKSKEEQMALVLRFVDKNGFIQERFFDVVHVKEFAALTLKEEVCAILSRHNLDVSNIRGQGYDGASDMREEWNDLKALFLNDCPHAYHIHCFAHRLQLALIGASSEVIPVCQFFSRLTFIINSVCSSSNCHDDLQVAKLDEIAHLPEIDELETDREATQIGTLKQVGDTRWGSHFSSICSLINMYGAICDVLEKIIDDGSTYSQRGDAYIAYNSLTSFEFILILHLMRDIMGITDSLCQAIQQQSQDVVDVVHLVCSTKALLQNLREDGWEKLLKSVTSFCEKQDIEVPEFNAPYVARQGRSHHQKDDVTIEHYFRVEVFFLTIDKQLQELNSRFNDQAIELLTLSSALVPKDTYKAFNIDNICILVEKYYPMDFNEQEKIDLRIQLQHFTVDARQESNLKNLSTIHELCTCLATTKKLEVYYLIDRLLRLIMTLPVSMATTERSFSAMKTMKSMLKNEIEAEFLADSMIIYIEREIAASFSSDSIIDDFKLLKGCRASF